MKCTICGEHECQHLVYYKPRTIKIWFYAAPVHYWSYEDFNFVNTPADPTGRR